MDMEVAMNKKIIKILIQVSIIYIIYFIGNFISNLIENIVVIPGNIIGMILLLVLLTTNVLKLSMIEETANFMLKYMGFFFVPLTVGLMESYKLIENNIIQLMVILFISCIVVMFFTGKATDMLISYKEKKK